MAKWNLVEFNYNGNRGRGYLILLCGDTADKAAADLLELATADIRVRIINPSGSWQSRTVVPSNKDIKKEIVPFISKDKASPIAKRINTKANEIRAGKHF